MARSSIIEEFFVFLKENKKWWLLPILLFLGIFGFILALASSSGAAYFPFIYTLF